MVSTTEVFSDNIPIYPMTSSPVKKPSAQKSLCIFSNFLCVNKKTAYRRVGADKFNLKAIKYRNTPWALKKTEKGTQKSVTR